MAPPPVFSSGFDDAPARTDTRTRMIAFIRANFADMLGADVDLLDAPGGLDALAAKLHARARDSR